MERHDLTGDLRCLLVRDGRGCCNHGPAASLRIGYGSLSFPNERFYSCRLLHCADRMDYAGSIRSASRRRGILQYESDRQSLRVCNLYGPISYAPQRREMGSRHTFPGPNSYSQPEQNDDRCLPDERGLSRNSGQINKPEDENTPYWRGGPGHPCLLGIVRSVLRHLYHCWQPGGNLNGPHRNLRVRAQCGG